MKIHKKNMIAIALVSLICLSSTNVFAASNMKFDKGSQKVANGLTWLTDYWMGGNLAQNSTNELVGYKYNKEVATYLSGNYLTKKADYLVGSVKVTVYGSFWDIPRFEETHSYVG